MFVHISMSEQPATASLLCIERSMDPQYDAPPPKRSLDTLYIGFWSMMKTILTSIIRSCFRYRVGNYGQHVAQPYCRGRGSGDFGDKLLPPPHHVKSVVVAPSCWVTVISQSSFAEPWRDSPAADTPTGKRQTQTARIGRGCPPRPEVDRIVRIPSRKGVRVAVREAARLT